MNDDDYYNSKSLLVRGFEPRRLRRTVIFRIACRSHWALSYPGRRNLIFEAHTHTRVVLARGEIILQSTLYMMVASVEDDLFPSIYSGQSRFIFPPHGSRTVYISPCTRSVCTMYVLAFPRRKEGRMRQINSQKRLNVYRFTRGEGDELTLYIRQRVLQCLMRQTTYW